MNKELDKKAYELMKLDSKVALVVTDDGEGYPHITFLSSLEGISKTELAFGSFCWGLSKKHIKERPDISFMVLTADYRFARGRARFTHTADTGEVYDSFNNKPLFRYNCYMGFKTIYFLDLVGVTPVEKLNMAGIILGAIGSRIAAPFKSITTNGALKSPSKRLFAGLANLKFISWYENGIARIVPIVGATHAGADRVIFPFVPYKKELVEIPIGAPVAVYCMNLNMESVLVKGVYEGGGNVAVKRVYNSAPPKLGYIYG